MFLQKLFNHFKTPLYPSRIHGYIKVGRSFGKKAIFIGDVPQSGGEFIYAWNTAISSLYAKHPNIRSCLLLGVAGGTAINALQKYFPEVKIAGIEIDPVILEVALAHKLFTRDKNIVLHTSDAIDWVQTDKAEYDLVIIDLFDGLRNIPQARTETFLRNIHKRVSLRGSIIYNSDFDENDQERFTAFTKLVEQNFHHMEILFAYPRNKMIYAAKSL